MSLQFCIETVNWCIFFFLKLVMYFFPLYHDLFRKAWHKRLGNRHKVDIYPEIGIILCYFFHPCLSCGLILSSGKLHLQGAKSSWTDDCKAVSCTHINYLFISNLKIKQVKVQEMIARIVFWNLCLEKTHQSKWNRQYLYCMWKKIQQSDSWGIRSVEINSLVHPVKSRKHWWARLHKIIWI